MGLIAKYRLINQLFSIGTMRIDGGKKDGNEQMDIQYRKGIELIELVKHYTELARTIRDAGEFLRRCAEISWSNGNEDLVEWNERKGDKMYHLVDLYDEEVVKLKRRLHELIQTSDELLTLRINWRDTETLVLTLYKIL